ncbi:MAG TPA: SCO family protein [Stellaceae bacterium]|nr:SCO family protein [Stellaceae bacterium]
MSRFYAVLAALAGAAIAAAVVVLAVMLWQGPQGRLGASVLPTIGGPFHLVDQQGTTVTDRNLVGTWSIIYFGYTRCPDECPTALNNIALALDRLDERQRAQVHAVFITVDPEHDTPAVLKAYIAKFAAPILALTGTPAEIAQAAKAYRVYYAPPAKEGGSEVEHSSIIYLMDPRGRFVTNFSGAAKPEEIARALKKRLS